ncbi:sugar kinase [Candidatus Soleaferrea massiliensis]|uniref:sugar kinase n=1 Tax=Candidatus Soleaferrea massiliensis TaxID=1470354 RepID=UPI000590A63F|nr:sugar kinase [Candidatus Soleaferrea massiliensis]
MSYEIISIGGLLVEIMRKELDKPFDKAADLTGPYPSGDTPITINAAAKLGRRCAYIGVVGDDDFGACVTGRLQESGVSMEMIRTVPGATTGTAFVSYFSDGSRKFIYHWRHAAAGMLDECDVDPKKLEGVKWVHVTGVTISSSESSARAVYKLIRELPEGAKLSFDPNIRPEVLSVEEIRKLCAPAVERADIIFPSATEAAMFTGAATDDEGCRIWAKQGKIVVLKCGKEGCKIYSGEDVFTLPTFPVEEVRKVEEVDPTGAGDTFCGAFLTAILEGRALRECGRFANAAASLSILKKGPMEGAPTREEVLELLGEQ